MKWICRLIGHRWERYYAVNDDDELNRDELVMVACSRCLKINWYQDRYQGKAEAAR